MAGTQSLELSDEQIARALARLQASRERRAAEPIALADGDPTSLMVGFWLDAEAARQLAVKGGIPQEQLHLTLCVCGEMADLGDLTAARAVVAVENQMRYQAPLTGRVSGWGRFLATESSDGQDVIWAAVDVPGLADLRRDVAMQLSLAGASPKSNHDFIPHITLAYVAPGANSSANMPAELPLRFDRVTVAMGARRVDIPLSGEASMIDVYGGPMAYAEGSATEPTLFAEPTSLHPRSGIGKNAWCFASAVRLGEAPEWVQYLPPPGIYHHSVWGKLELPPEKLERMVANFHNRVFEQILPIDAEHDRDSSGAVGYIVDMRLAADGSIEVKPEWNERGSALIAGDRFKYVSASYWDEWQEPVSGEWIPDVAVGMAICTTPHFKENALRPLVASEAGALHVAGRSGREDTSVTDQDAQNTTPPAANQAVQLSEADAAAFRQFMDAGGPAAFGRMEAAVQAVAAENAALKQDRLERRFTDIARGKAEDADGAPWHGDIAVHVGLMRDLAETFGEDSEQVKRYVAVQTASANALRESPLLRATGTGRGNDAPAVSAADETAKRVALLREANPTLSVADAQRRVFSEDPALYERSRRQAYVRTPDAEG